MTHFTINRQSLKIIESMASATLFSIKDITFRIEDKVLMCRLRAPEGCAAVVFKSIDTIDTDIEGMKMFTIATEDVATIIKLFKDEDNVTINIVNNAVNVKVGNIKKKFPLTQEAVWMDRVPNPPITQTFTMTSDQTSNIVSAFEAKEKHEVTRISFTPDNVTFVNINNQRQTDALFEKQEFGRTVLDKTGHVGFFSVPLMKVMNLIPKEAVAEINVDIDMPIAITFVVGSGWFKILLAPIARED